MGLFNWKKEERAEEVQFEDALLKALLGQAEITKETALQIPTVSGGIDLIAGIVASTPIKLYMEKDGKAEEVKDDERIFLLNDETGDTLNANEFWHAMIRDYYVGKGGYAYINKARGKIKSVHYVDEREIVIQRNTDPIFKEFDIMVQGKRYKPFEFFRILRNTRDGAEGVPLTKENSKVISTAYQQLILEQAMARRGGKKKGFLQTENKIESEAMAALKTAWREMYSEDGDGTIILNKGLKFQEASDTAAEMQLAENKAANAGEFAKLFHVSTQAISGVGADINALAKLAAIPLMNAIQCALNNAFLLEREKGKLYFAFDTKELLKGEMAERFAAYKTALDANFMQIDEVRFAEDMEPLGLQWIKLGLNDVLYNPKTGQIYTPNTNQMAQMNGNMLNLGEDRAGNYIQDPKTGQMMGSTPSSSKSGLTNGQGGSNLQSSKPNWSKKQQKEPFDYWAMQEDKTGFPRNLKASGFSSKDTKTDHYERHGKGVNAASEDEYEAAGKEFFSRARGSGGDAFVAENGDVYRFDYNTGEFGSMTKTGIVKTYWNIAAEKNMKYAVSYWQDERKDHGK